MVSAPRKCISITEDVYESLNSVREFLEHPVPSMRRRKSFNDAVKELIRLYNLHRNFGVLEDVTKVFRDFPDDLKDSVACYKVPRVILAGDFTYHERRILDEQIKGLLHVDPIWLESKVKKELW